MVSAGFLLIAYICYTDLTVKMGILKQICSYCLILVVLFYTTPLKQLLKVPAMLEHYKEHKALDHRISFLDFVFMHYVGDDGVTYDNDKDMQLPFKKSDRASFEAYSSLGTELSFMASHEPTTVCYVLYKSKFLSDPYYGDLLKPPQA